jgi:hypothetical protein
MGNPYLKGIDPNRSQSRGIEEIASLGEDHVWFEDRWMVASLCDE